MSDSYIKRGCQIHRCRVAVLPPSSMKILPWLVCLMTLSALEARPQAPSAEYGPPKEGGYPSGGPAGGPGLSYKGDGSGGGGGGGGDEGVTEEANYSFAYEVKDEPSMNDFGHEETRMGDVAMGSYHVLLPDGRMQKVTYTADKDGYKPVITYEGEIKGYGPEVGGGNTGGGGGGGGGNTGGGGGGGSGNTGAVGGGSSAPKPEYGPPAAGGYRYR